MTKEEALDIIRFVFLHTDNHLNEDRPISAEDIHEALVMACAALYKNSLPSDLDVAAHRYAWEKQEHHIDFDGNEYLDYGPRYDAFKAGAELMAGQGISYDATISADKTIPVLPMKDVSNMGFDYGDNVTVQIRKK